MRKAIVRDGTVENVVVLPDDWTGAAGEWQPPKAVELVDANNRAAPGAAWDGTKFTRKPATRKPVIPGDELVDRFTDEELAAVWASTDASVIRWRSKALATPHPINLKSQRTQRGFDALVTANILTQERADDILKP